MKTENEKEFKCIPMLHSEFSVDLCPTDGQEFAALQVPYEKLSLEM